MRKQIEYTYASIDKFLLCSLLLPIHRTSSIPPLIAHSTYLRDIEEIHQTDFTVSRKLNSTLESLLKEKFFTEGISEPELPTHSWTEEFNRKRQNLVSYRMKERLKLMKLKTETGEKYRQKGVKYKETFEEMSKRVINEKPYDFDQKKQEIIRNRIYKLTQVKSVVRIKSKNAKRPTSADAQRIYRSIQHEH